MSLVLENICNQRDNETAIYYLTRRQDIYAVSTQNWNIADTVIKIYTVGPTCERYNYSFLNVKFHMVFTTPLLYQNYISLKRFTIFNRLYVSIYFQVIGK
jgi:hypothetical protein